MFGYIVLYSWPLAVFAFFRIWSPAVALSAAILGGYLFLPTQFSLELPGFPSLNKDTLPAIAALVSMLAIAGNGGSASQPGWIPRGIIPITLLIGMVLSTVLTVLANRDPLFYGPLVFPALRPWDIFSTLLSTGMMLLPMFLGRKLLARPEEQILLLKALVVAGAGYSLLALYEIRMSPQLNYMVYGFFPHAWEQHVRGNGYRPIVFVHHGLWLSIFFAMSVLAAAGLGKCAKVEKDRTYLILCFWLLTTLILSKSLGALSITVVLLCAVLFLSMRLQFWIAATFAGIALLYPMLRGADLVPVNTIMGWVQSISLDRSGSLEFRIVNENLLLEKAQERSLFGWGGWGRNFVYDPATGEGLSLIADGYWVGAIGVGGWARYLSEFGLFCLPEIIIAFTARRFKLGPETAILSLVLVANVVDLLPNATATPITWLITGALWGRLELGHVRGTAPDFATAMTEHPISRYGRSATPSQGHQPEPEDTGDSPPSPAYRYSRQTRMHHRRPNPPKDRKE